MNELTIAKKVSFGALTIDCYMDRDGNAYVTREAIGRALEYPHSLSTQFTDGTKSALTAFQLSSF